MTAPSRTPSTTPAPEPPRRRPSTSSASASTRSAPATRPPRRWPSPTPPAAARARRPRPPSTPARSRRSTSPPPAPATSPPAASRSSRTPCRVSAIRPAWPAARRPPPRSSSPSGCPSRWSTTASRPTSTTSRSSSTARTSTRVLPNTLSRGYVQIETPSWVTAHPGVSQHYPLVNEQVNGTSTPVLEGGVQVYGVTRPQWLGPTLVATKDKPTRIRFHNLLPTGAGGDLFIPTDSTFMGAGMGPMAMAPPVDNGSVLDGVRNPVCDQSPKPASCYKDNRATLHLHGGLTPWISDGTPHQWITPAGETTLVAAGRGRPGRPRHDAQEQSHGRHPDLLLHQPAERAADVLPRPRLRHHAPQRVHRRGRRLHHPGQDRGEARRHQHHPRSGRHDPADRPGPHLRAERHADVRPEGRPGQRHQLRPGPDLERGPLRRLRQLLVQPRVHAGPEPRRPHRPELRTAAGSTAPGSGRRPPASPTDRSPTPTTTRPASSTSRRPGSTRRLRTASRRRSRAPRTTRPAWSSSTTRRP